MLCHLCEAKNPFLSYRFAGKIRNLIASFHKMTAFRILQQALSVFFGSPIFPPAPRLCRRDKPRLSANSPRTPSLSFRPSAASGEIRIPRPISRRGRRPRRPVCEAESNRKPLRNRRADCPRYRDGHCPLPAAFRGLSITPAPRPCHFDRAQRAEKSVLPRTNFPCKPRRNRRFPHFRIDNSEKMPDN